jgi:hypothetical protein
MRCRLNAFQIRITAVWASPDPAAIERVDQCVAWTGVDSSVVVITATTRDRHFAIVARWIPNSAAIPLGTAIPTREHGTDPVFV